MQKILLLVLAILSIQLNAASASKKQRSIVSAVKLSDLDTTLLCEAQDRIKSTSEDISNAANFTVRVFLTHYKNSQRGTGSLPLSTQACIIGHLAQLLQSQPTQVNH